MDGDGDGDLEEDSYYGTDVDIWDRREERDKDVTLPLDSTTPLIEEVERD